MNNIEEFFEAITPNEGFVNEYSLTGIKEFEIGDGVAWTGELRRNNTIVGSVECRGDGGCYSYSFKSPQDRAAFMQAVTDAYYMRDMIDVEEDCFVNFLDLQSSMKASA